MQFGISTHLVHGERLARQHLALIAAHGFELVELFATASHLDYRSPTAVSEARGWLDALGLTAWSLHAPIVDGFRQGVWGRAFSLAAASAARRQEAVDETLAALEAARILGCATMVVHLGVPSEASGTNDNDRDAMRRSLEALLHASRGSGVRLALEVLPAGLATPDALARWFSSDLDLNDAGICLDVGHAHLSGGAPEAIELLAGHLLTTHVHDNRGQSDDHLVPFGGTVDWPMTAAALSKVGYTGPLIFELPDHGDVERTLSAAVGAQQRLQAILNDLSQPLGFEFVE
jgi:sugar phosphate isomerase/epimerase